MQIRAARRVPFFGMSAISLRTSLIISLALSVGACTMNETQQRVGTGAAMGAVAGALIGGNSSGALIGAAVGAGGGYLVDQTKKRESSDAENQQLREENYRLQQQAQ
jgi:uncharacterized membrane protein